MINSKTTNCIIIHGCPSNSKEKTENWIPWLKHELSAKKIVTQAPLMPKPWKPDYSAFKEEFEKNKIAENTILIGHSCGCSFLVRWLGDTKQKISKLILIAPWKIPDNSSQKEFYGFKIDKSIKSRVKEIIFFTADDEEKEGKESLKIFHEALNGKIIELKGKGHYILEDMGTEKFPELLDEILN